MNLLTDTQKRTAKAIVSIFETSSVQGDYSKVTLLPGDSGQLTYGHSQTTLGSGNLFKLIDAYCRRPGARLAARLEPYLDALEAKDPALNEDGHFHNLLRASADDPVMRDTQDEFFDTEYWASAERIAKRDKLCQPLSVAVVYDSIIHGSWTRMRRRVLDAIGTPEAAGEQAWIAKYVETRHEWLANHRNTLLRKTVYRMETFHGLIEHDAWTLELPLVVRRHEINLETLHAPPPHVYDSPLPRSRELRVTSPLMKGLDVRWVQFCLSAQGHDLVADGLYGRGSAAAVEVFQQAQGLPITGSVDLDDFVALGL